MKIKRLEKEEIEDAILFATRQKPDDLMQILNKCMRDKLFYWGYFEEEQLCGVISISNEGFLTTFYVSPGKNNVLMQRQLLEYAGNVLKNVYEINKIIATVDKKELLGYKDLGFEQIETTHNLEEDGQLFYTVRYTILPTVVTQGNVHRVTNRTKIIIIAVILLLIAAVVGVFWYFQTKQHKSVGSTLTKLEEPEQKVEDTSSGYKAKASGIGDKDYKPQNIEDIMKVEPYIGTDITYGVKAENYSLKQTNESGELDFQVQYPVLVNLSSKKAEAINNLIKNTAMSTVNLLYLNASDETKALWKDEKKPYLYSHVKYQITYMNNNFISIVFEDHYYMGNISSEYLDARTLNINLKDGSQYKLKDVVNLNDTFQKSWYYRMSKKSPESWVLPDLSEEDCKMILNGEDQSGRYWEEYFLHANGVEVGFTYHHQGSKGISRGWLTCKYSYEEMKTYKTQNSFWNYIQMSP